MADKPISQTRFYNIWQLMRHRCLNPSNPSFKNYGDRGIFIDNKWMTFGGFFDDMHESYENSDIKNPQIDRIDNNDGYYKENCKWSSKKEQANNRRTSRLIKWRGKTKTLSQWCDHLKLKPSTVRQRFYVYGWSINKCFTYGE